MAVKRYKPTSAARRFMTVPNYKEQLSGDKAERSLLEDQRKSGGRNNAGRITVRHIGGGNKRKYRVIDFKRNKDGIPATVKSIPSPQRSRASSTIPTAARTSPSSSMQTAKSATSSLPSASTSATR